MATYNSGGHALKGNLQSSGVSQAVAKMIARDLHKDGVTKPLISTNTTPGKSNVWAPPSGSHTVNTKSDPNLHAIVANNTILNITGGLNTTELIATGDGYAGINLGHGSYNIVLGSGPDTINASSAQVTITGGAGSNGDLVQLGSAAANSVDLVGANHATLMGGSGADQFIGADGTGNLLSAGGGNHQTVAAWGDNNTLVGGSGAHDVLAGFGSHDTFDVGGADGAGIGGGTLIGSGGNELFQIGNAGSDTIDAAGGNNTVSFLDHPLNSDVSTATVGSVTTVSFSDTDQSFTISGVQTLHFQGGGHETI